MMQTDREKLKAQKEKILELVRAFCKAKLDEEYCRLAEKMTEKLARKRPSPLLRGKPEIWAAGIIHALGTTNFLFDRDFEPYVSLDEINDFFGTKKSTSGNKAKLIRDMFKLDARRNEEFLTERIKKANPFRDMVMINGFLVPISMLPEELQEIVRQAKAQQGGNLSINIIEVDE